MPDDIFISRLCRGWSLETADIAKNARAITMLISCSAKAEENAKKLSNFGTPTVTRTGARRGD